MDDDDDNDHDNNDHDDGHLGRPHKFRTLARTCATLWERRAARISPRCIVVVLGAPSVSLLPMMMMTMTKTQMRAPTVVSTRTRDATETTVIADGVLGRRHCCPGSSALARPLLGFARLLLWVSFAMLLGRSAAQSTTAFACPPPSNLRSFLPQSLSTSEHNGTTDGGLWAAYNADADADEDCSTCDCCCWAESLADDPFATGFPLSCTLAVAPSSSPSSPSSSSPTMSSPTMSSFALFPEASSTVAASTTDAVIETLGPPWTFVLFVFVVALWIGQSVSALLHASVRWARAHMTTSASASAQAPTWPTEGNDEALQDDDQHDQDDDDQQQHGDGEITVQFFVVSDLEDARLLRRLRGECVRMRPTRVTLVSPRSLGKPENVRARSQYIDTLRVQRSEETLSAALDVPVGSRLQRFADAPTVVEEKGTRTTATEVDCVIVPPWTFVSTEGAHTPWTLLEARARGGSVHRRPCHVLWVVNVRHLTSLTLRWSEWRRPSSSSLPGRGNSIVGTTSVPQPAVFFLPFDHDGAGRRGAVVDPPTATVVDGTVVVTRPWPALVGFALAVGVDPESALQAFQRAQARERDPAPSSSSSARDDEVIRVGGAAGSHSRA